MTREEKQAFQTSLIERLPEWLTRSEFDEFEEGLRKRAWAHSQDPGETTMRDLDLWIRSWVINAWLRSDPEWRSDVDRVEGLLAEGGIGEFQELDLASLTA